MRTATFMNIAAKFATTLGRKDSVRVVYGGKEAFTDGKTINIPALPAGTEFTPWQESVFLGYLDHEVGHVRFTDFGEMRRRFGEKGEKYELLLNHLFQVFEDVREETLQIAEYPGSKAKLDILSEEVDRTIKSRSVEVKSPDDKEARKVLGLVYKEAWVKYRGVTHTDGLPEGWLAETPAYEPIARVMMKIPRLGSTTDSFNLAEEVKRLLPSSVVKAMKKVQEQQKKQVQKFVGLMGTAIGGLQKGQKSKEGSSPGEGSFGAELKEDQEGSDGTPEQKSEISGSETPGSGTSGQELDAPTPREIQKMEKVLGIAAAALSDLKDRSEVFEAMLEDVKKKNQQDDSKGGYAGRKWGTTIFPPAAPDQDKVFVPSGKNRARFLAEREELSPQIQALKKMVRIFLQTRTVSTWARGLEEGKLDSSALWKLFLGSKFVRKEQRTRTMMDTAVLLLVDLSGSMSSTSVRKAAIAIAEACSSIQQLSLCVAGFMTSNRFGGSFQKGGKGVGRLDAMDLLMFKGFDEPYRMAADRFGAINTSGYTPLGDAYGKAFEFIKDRKEPRKVIWLISDGEPYFSVGDEQHSDPLLMERVHTKCKRNRIDTVGLGIAEHGSSLNLKRWVDQYGEIQSMAQLPAVVLTTLKGIVR